MPPDRLITQRNYSSHLRVEKVLKIKKSLCESEGFFIAAAL